MARFGVGMRWWLALAFALIAAVTALVTAQVFSGRAESDFERHAEEIAIGNATAASIGITRALQRGDLGAATEIISERRELAIFVFDAQGKLLTPSRSLRTRLEWIPLRDEALVAALQGESFVMPFENGKRTLVGLPLEENAGALVAYATRPELAAGLGIARGTIVGAALWAILVGAAAGLVVAALITVRLRRIARAATAIESGDFERELRPGFRDELGALATSIDSMRLRLSESFAALEGERESLHRLLERLREGVLTVDDELRVEYANAAARRLLGVDSLGVGAPLPEPWPDASLRGLAARLFDPGAEPVEVDLAPDEATTYFVVGIPAHDGSAAVLVVTDVSERERRERSQREFVANAAHELRTPLSVIAGAVEMLQAGAKETPEERDRFLDHIEREAGRLGRLARALLVLARAQTRAEPIRLEPVELEPLLERVATDLRRRAAVPVRVECAPGLAAVAQPDLAEQIVANLADNAGKHTRHGEIALRAAERPGRRVAIEVSDTGSGIAPEDRDAIFERFYRGRGREGEGFGLGLAIVRQAVLALGGELSLESAPGRGTSVGVVLPAAPAGRAPALDELERAAS
jgi:two-component system phosphate regulon sensor histidine kinase PhoR